MCERERVRDIVWMLSESDSDSESESESDRVRGV